MLPQEAIRANQRLHAQSFSTGTSYNKLDTSLAGCPLRLRVTVWLSNQSVPCDAFDNYLFLCENMRRDWFETEFKSIVHKIFTVQMLYLDLLQMIVETIKKQ